MKKLLFLFFGLGIIISCSSNDSDTDTTSNPNAFDRAALLTNWADNIIVPRYEIYKQKTVLLESATTLFVNTPNTVNLDLLRNAWFEAYKSYQSVALFNFGKAEAIRLNDISNTYPTDVAGIENNVASGGYNLNLNAQYAKQGYPAIDYLLNGLGTDDVSVLKFYTSDANAAKYKQYLSAVIKKVNENSAVVLDDWKASFRDTYVKNNGTSVTSAVNSTTNAFVKHFEKDIRTAKVGIAAGKFSNGIKFPEKVEGLYKNDISKTLLNIAIQSSKDFFNGKSSTSEIDGAGLKSFLDYVKAERDGVLLSSTINKQYDAVLNSTSVLNESFSNQVNANNSKMLLTYDAMQKLVIYTKLDMMQALNISIDYVDGDGD